MKCADKESNQKGKVWLVGAGPSEMELLTIKGKRLLQQAQVIVYDRLAGSGVLSYGAKDAQYINVGKCPGRHSVPQDEINQILLQNAQEGKRVVRLKGGDPFVFGRGAEEIELLREHQIPFEIVPGVTSVTAVPAYQGIPVTHRDVASSFHVITAHKKQGEPMDIPYEALVQTKGTLLFLMGVSVLFELAQGLVKAGMAPETPVAVLEQGTTAKQRKIMGTLHTIAERAKEANVKSPAIIVVGGVCALSGLEWYQSLPLSGKQIVVTRPKGQISRISSMLREKGAEVLEMPSIRIEPSFDRVQMEKVLAQIEVYSWLVFTSPSGVEVFFDILAEMKMDIRSLWKSKIAAIGDGTQRALKARGIYPDLIPEIYDGEHLGIALGNCCEETDRILIPRARIGNPELVQEIEQRSGAQVTDVPIYDTIYETAPYIDYETLFTKEGENYALFTSASTVKGFAAMAEESDLSHVTALCIGRQTQEEAKKYHMRTMMAKEATLQALVELAESI